MLIPSGALAAAACISGGEGYGQICGTVKFFPCHEGVLVLADIFGLPQANPGIFALHIHEGDSCGGTAFADSGGHYNPGEQPHPQHAGDLPPLFECRGHALLATLTCRFAVEDIIGRTVIIHSGVDDFTSQPSGNSGSKIACGVIERV